MKILEVQIFDTKSCGPTSVMKQIAPRIIRQGHIVDVFSVRKYSSDREKLAGSLGMNYFHTNGEFIMSVNDILKYVPSLHNYDVVHIHGIYELNHFVLTEYLKKENIPYVVSIHGNLMSSALKQSRFKKLIALNMYIKKMLKSSSSIHIMAKNEMVDVKKLIGKHNYNMIYNGVEFTDLIRKNVINKETLNILFIGRLDVNHKGIDLLINAISSKIEIFDKKIKLYLVGPYDSNKDKRVIESLICSVPQLKDVISIEGPKYDKEKEKYYDLCDVFIHTSRFEGMPVAVLEAMDHGMPCIVTPGTNMAEILTECKGGIVVQESVYDIAEGIIKAQNISREDLFNMGKAAQIWSRENLNWDKIAVEYEKMYRDLKHDKI